MTLAGSHEGVIYCADRVPSKDIKNYRLYIEFFVMCEDEEYWKEAKNSISKNTAHPASQMEI